MSRVELTLIAVGVKKWDLESQKINLNSYYLLDDVEKSIAFDVSILQAPEMVEEFLGKTRYEVTQELSAKSSGDDEPDVHFDNETFLRQKLYNYFKRITSELNNPKRKKGQPKMIFTTQMDIYNENQDISFLPKRIQFFVVLNWARKYYDREEYKRAVEPLRKLIKIDATYGLGFKWLARSLKKIRKYDEAMRYYEKYAEVDGTIEARLDLAKSYRKGKIFEKSESIYRDILKQDPKNKEAKIGIAQIQYANNDKAYLDALKELNKEDAGWLKNWLNDEFNFRIYINDKTFLSPVQAAKFLGFNKTRDLTDKAFKNELPSHFNPSKARMSFFQEELDNWAMVMNMFKCLPQEVKTYPDKIDSTEDFPAADTNENDSDKSGEGGGKPTTKVEEILRQIRARKAERQAEQEAAAAEAASEKPKGSAKGAGAKPKKRAGGGRTGKKKAVAAGAKKGSGN